MPLWESQQLTKRNIDQVDQALRSLQDDPELLEKQRAEINRTPCSTPIDLQDTPQFTPVFSIEGRRLELRWDHDCSRPAYRFHKEIADEFLRMQDFDYLRRKYPGHVSYRDKARDTVRQRWKEQGIWNDDWEDEPTCEINWKHELPVEPVSSHETPPSGTSPPGSPSAARQIKTKNRQSTVEDRHREASRPFFQFMYQVSLERRLLMEEINDVNFSNSPRSQPVPPVPPPIDINTQVYNIVKRRWLRDRIWNRKWGVLPGMSWHHEEPLEEYIQDRMYDNGLSPASEPYWAHEAASLPSRAHSGYIELERSPSLSPLPPYFPPSDTDTSDLSQHIDNERDSALEDEESGSRGLDFSHGGDCRPQPVAQHSRPNEDGDHTTNKIQCDSDISRPQVGDDGNHVTDNLEPEPDAQDSRLNNNGGHDANKAGPGSVIISQSQFDDDDHSTCKRKYEAIDQHTQVNKDGDGDGDRVIDNLESEPVTQPGGQPAEMEVQPASSTGSGARKKRRATRPFNVTKTRGKGGSGLGSSQRDPNRMQTRSMKRLKSTR